MQEIITEMRNRAGILWNEAQNPRTIQEDAVLMRGKARAYEEVVEYLEALDPSLCTIMSVFAKVREIDEKARKAGLLVSFNFAEDRCRMAFYHKVGEYGVGPLVKEIVQEWYGVPKSTMPMTGTIKMGAVLDEAEKFVGNYDAEQVEALEKQVKQLTESLKVARTELRRMKGGKK